MGKKKIRFWVFTRRGAGAPAPDKLDLAAAAPVQHPSSPQHPSRVRRERPSASVSLSVVVVLPTRAATVDFPHVCSTAKAACSNGRLDQGHPSTRKGKKKRDSNIHVFFSLPRIHQKLPSPLLLGRGGKKLSLSIWEKEGFRVEFGPFLENPDVRVFFSPPPTF